MSEFSSQPNAAGDTTSDSPLIAAAIAALQAAAKVQLSEETLLVEERNTWQPESWLIQRCWQVLADAAIGTEALELAGLVADRHPNAPVQALYRLAEQYQQQPALGPLLQHELQRWHYRLFHTHPEEANQIERLLLVAVSAALADDRRLATACLERLDNLPKGWERVVARPDLRDQLALCIVQIGPHPLINDLINIAIRRFDDAGALFLHALTTLLVHRLAAVEEHMTADGAADNATVTQWQRLLTHALDTVRNATLVSMQSRRVAAMIMGQAGEVHEVLVQVETIERVQTAQRETGYTVEKENPSVLRQVKRTNANSDVDFLVYTLRNAVDAMPLRQLRREDRLVLADKLALLGIQSDGWTAAGAAATLVTLGALRYAGEVVEHISPRDPARSEGLLMLVRSLLAVGETELAAEQTQQALDWAESMPVRNPERALIWGLAEIYLQHQQPSIALQLLARWREPTGWRATLRNLWREQLDDDGLRNRRLRLQALLQHSLFEQRVVRHDPMTQADSMQADIMQADIMQDNTLQERSTQDRLGHQESPVRDGMAEQVAEQSAPTVGAGSTTRFGATLDVGTSSELRKEIQSLVRTLQRAAPRLLDGEALIQFSIEGLLRPLLEAGYYPEAWALLPDLKQALGALSGNKQAVRVQEVTDLLHSVLQSSRKQRNTVADADVPQQPRPDHATLQPFIEGFLRDLWRAGVVRGLWQVVHTIEGTLPLLLYLEGTPALVAIAHAAHTLQRTKLPPLSTPIHSSPALRTR